ncbi:S-layer homology domain-containing protein [Paenibacillus oceani]|nr:S-layer homology domain-containing protein [Paenibacillus oceani]
MYGRRDAGGLVVVTLGEAHLTDLDTVPAWALETVRDAGGSACLEGYLDGTIRPNQTVSRSEMAVMMARLMKWDMDRTQTTAFADDADIPDWAKVQIHVAYQRGLVEGREGNRYMPEFQTDPPNHKIAVGLNL